MRNLINPDAAHKIARGQQIHGYRTGGALQNHINSAHEGVVCESCPACKEIQRKMEGRKAQ
jgi:hypothetical protein